MESLEQRMQPSHTRGRYCYFHYGYSVVEEASKKCGIVARDVWVYKYPELPFGQSELVINKDVSNTYSDDAWEVIKFSDMNTKMRRFLCTLEDIAISRDLHIRVNWDGKKRKTV